MNSNNKMSAQMRLKLLSSVLELMVTAGVSEKAIRSSFERGLIQSRRLRPEGRARRSDGLYQARGDASALLLRTWFRDARLVDDQTCNPRPLHPSRGRQNLHALIKSLDSSADPREVIREMRSADLIRKTASGKYLPTKNAMIIPSLHPWTIEHAVRSITRLVSTVNRNARRESGSPPLLERYSYVPDLDPSQGLTFAEFSQSQGQAFLEVLDDWLEQRRIRKTSSKKRSGVGLPAGVHIIAYLGEDAKANVRAPSKAAVDNHGAERRASIRGGRARSQKSTTPPSTPS